MRGDASETGPWARDLSEMRDSLPKEDHRCRW